MLSQLLMIVVMMSFDSYPLGGAVHPLDLTIDPGMIWLGQAGNAALQGVKAVIQRVCGRLRKRLPTAMMFIHRSAESGDHPIQQTQGGKEKILKKFMTDLQIVGIDFALPMGSSRIAV